MNSASELQELYLDYLEDTECPTMYHRWSFLAGIGAILERKIWFPFGPQTIYPNQYIILVGPPAARKSTAVNALGDLLLKSGYVKFATDKSSKEKFIEDLSKGFDITRAYEDDKIASFSLEEIFEESIDDTENEISPVFIKAGELQEFLGLSNHDFISWLTDMWDNPSHCGTRVKHGKSFRANKPTISLLGGVTGVTFQNIFPTTVLEQGILSRVLLIYGTGRRKKITFPKPLPQDLEEKLISQLIKIRNEVQGVVTLTKEAEIALDAIYKNWKDLPDTRFEHYTGRRFTHLLKLSMINAAMRISTKINKEDVILANTILSYTENFMPQALGEFGKSERGRAINTILQKIKAAGETGITMGKLRMEIMDLNIDMHTLQSHIEQLRSLGRIDHIKREDELGSFITHLVAIKRNEILMNKFTDFSLLRESKNFKYSEDNEDDGYGEIHSFGV